MISIHPYLKRLVILLILFSSKTAYACYIPFINEDPGRSDSGAIYLNYGRSDVLTERSLDVEGYCWSFDVYTAMSISQISTPGYRNYAFYWYVGWADTRKVSFFVDYGFDLGEAFLYVFTRRAGSPIDDSIDLRFTTGLIFRTGSESQIRVYYRYNKLSNDLVLDGRYTYYGVSFGTKT